MKALVLGFVLALATSAVAQQGTTTSCKHTVTGQLQVFPFDSKVFGNTRLLRVWLPPGYDDSENSTKRYPVLYMFDGQALFDACTAPGGTEWQVDETLTRLIREDKIDPIIVVGIDSAGDRFLNEYLPWRDVIQGLPQQGQPHGVRMPAFMLGEVMPVIEARYRIAKGAENTGIGGSSAGAVAAVYVTLQAPGTFGKLLAESIVAWVGNGQLVRDSTNIAEGPERAWFGLGGREAHYPGLHMTDTLRKMTEQIVANFRATPLRPCEVQFTFDPLGGHNEQSWSRRFPDAILFLFGHAPSSSAPPGQFYDDYAPLRLRAW